MFGVQMQRLLNRWVSLREDPYGLLNFTTKNVLSHMKVYSKKPKSSEYVFLYAQRGFFVIFEENIKLVLTASFLNV